MTNMFKPDIPAPPPPPPVVEMLDEEAVANARKRQAAKGHSRTGRRSTILSEAGSRPLGE